MITEDRKAVIRSMLTLSNMGDTERNVITELLEDNDTLHRDNTRLYQFVERAVERHVFNSNHWEDDARALLDS